MSYGRYLRRRGCTWFFRLRWPRRTVPCGVSGELVLSLRTSAYSVLRIQVEGLMSQFTSSMTREDLDTRIKNWAARCLWQETHRAASNGFAVLEA
jgi:hypothetical protein